MPQANTTCSTPRGTNQRRRNVPTRADDHIQRDRLWDGGEKLVAGDHVLFLETRGTVAMIWFGKAGGVFERSRQG